MATRLNQCTVYQRLDRGGVVDFPLKTTALITWTTSMLAVGAAVGNMVGDTWHGHDLPYQL